MTLHPRDQLSAAIKAAKPAKASKYRNVKTVVDGITFDSKAEARFYSELKARERAGEVFEVERQRPYPLTVNGFLVATYRSDFTFYSAITKRTHVVDVKGMKTPTFRLKEKLMWAIYRIKVECVK